jgi:ribonuclease HI
MFDSHHAPLRPSRRANLQSKRERDALQQEYYADPTEMNAHVHVHLPRALRFWPNDFLAAPRELFAHDVSELDPYYSPRAGRPARMIRFDAPSDEILLYSSASCLDQHNAHGDRRAASSCVFKPTGLHPSEDRSMALCLERRGPTGQMHPQESNRAHIRAAIAALQCREWREEGWSSVVIASDSEYLVEGITNWVEIWQETGWRTSRDTGNSREGNAVANQDLWELLLQEVSEASARGLEVKFWLIVHALNKEAQAEARLAAEMLKEEESFWRIPYAGEMRHA